MGWQESVFTTIIIESGVSGSGLFVYNGAPALGTLVAVIAAEAGTDPYGNSYTAVVNVGKWSASTGEMLQHFGIDTSGNLYLADDTGTTRIYENAADSLLAVYDSGGIAPGELLISLAGEAGTDPAGNTYPAGLRWNSPVSNMPAMSNGWTVGGHAAYALDPLGNLVVSFKDLVPGSVADGTTIWGAGSLPAAYVPVNSRRIVSWCDGLKTVGGNLEAAGLDFQTDGSVDVYGVSSGATRLDCFAVIPLEF
jgi:hypothetical protein